MDKPENPVKTKRSRFKWLLYIGFWLMMAVGFGGIIANRASEYNEMLATIQRLEAETEQAKSEYEVLQRRIAFVGSDAYIEQQARERLGLVKPKEIIFINVGQQ
jgi:cell division protein FtsB